MLFFSSWIFLSGGMRSASGYSLETFPVHDVLVTPRDVNPKETHEGGQRLAGYVALPEMSNYLQVDSVALPRLAAIGYGWEVRCHSLSR